MKITKIEEKYGYKYNDEWENFDGYKIYLENDSFIFLGIDNGQSCCENWGYYITHDDCDDLSSFIGAEILNYDQLKDSLNYGSNYKDGLEEYSCDAGGTMYVNIKTSRGLLQLTVYNDHNGYYGHSVVFMTDNFQISEGL